MRPERWKALAVLLADAIEAAEEKDQEVLFAAFDRAIKYMGIPELHKRQPMPPRQEVMPDGRLYEGLYEP